MHIRNSVIINGAKRGRNGLMSNGFKCCFLINQNFAFRSVTKVHEFSMHAIQAASKRSIKFPLSVMVWDAMSSAGVSNVFHIYNCQFRSILECFGKFHDSCSGRTVWSSRFLISARHSILLHIEIYDKGINVLDCSADSPDLNPTEKCGEL